MCCNVIVVPMEVVEGVIRDIEIRTIINTEPDWPARRVSAFPKASLPVIVSEDGALAPKVLKWGFEPSWSKSVLFNTRMETALDPQNSFWKAPLSSGRCVLPVFGFFEPHSTETTLSAKTGRPIKQQYLFEAPDAPLLFIAGIHDNRCFSLMTTEPNAWMAPVHPRMPVVLKQHELFDWLYGDYAALADRSKVELKVSKAPVG